MAYTAKISLINALIIKHRVALAIITMLPKLKYLVITESLIERNNFLRILESCKDLVHLDVSYCQGFREDNEEILKLTSHIDTFICEGCQNIYEDGDEESIYDDD